MSVLVLRSKGCLNKICAHHLNFSITSWNTGGALCMSLVEFYDLATISLWAAANSGDTYSIYFYYMGDGSAYKLDSCYLLIHIDCLNLCSLDSLSYCLSAQQLDHHHHQCPCIPKKT